MQPTHPTQFTQPMQPTHPAQPTFAMPPTMPAEPTTPRLSATPALPTTTAARYLSRQVVLVGYGRVGRRIAAALTAHDIPFVVAEQNRELVEKLRAGGAAAVWAANASVRCSTTPPHARPRVTIAPRNSCGVWDSGRRHEAQARV